jgi:hypothetical protein
MLLLLAAVVAFLLHNSFLPGQILFSNDGPLGRLESQCHHLPEAFTGVWQDLNTVGFREGGALPNITSGLRLVLTPVGFSKFYVPVALVILGLGAWCFFRQLRLAPLACILGGLAATLNSCFFSAACWGVGSLAITIGMVFFALGALADASSGQRWLRTMLAGLAIGMAVAEGADIGAIFSLYVAGFVIYQSWLTPGPGMRNMATGVARVALVATVAAFLAAQAITVLVQTQMHGVAAAREDLGTKEDPWDWATKWSLPKREALGLAIPGLFGFRLDTPEGGAYWGNTGRDPAWDRYLASGQQGPPPSGFIRYSGGGIYAGELVLLVALWAGLQSLRRKASVFSTTQRGSLWFWLVVGVTSLLLAFGRYAPFYRWLYALPYFSSLRNPTKFLHVLSFALVVLFAYGIDGLVRTCLMRAGTGVVSPPRDLKAWWAKATGFERRWTLGWLLALGLSLLAWKIYAGYHDQLAGYLQGVLFEASAAEQIAQFSIRQVGWFVVFFLLAGGLLVLLLGGRFAGPRAKWGGIFLGALLLLDLGRANEPWIVYWNYHDQYASNPVIDLLRSKPWMQRVSMFPFRMPPAYTLFGQLYRVEWLQHPFAYYNIQSLDVSQMPRSPADIDAFETTLRVDPQATNTLHRLVRRWELTNTRYLLGPTEALEVLNGQLDPVKKRFRIVTQFNLVPKAGFGEARDVQELTAALVPEGTYALIEFTGALPRASLYADWQVSTNDEATLARLASRDFEPQSTVLVAGGVVAPPAAATAPQTAGSVELTHYSPRDLVFKVGARTPSVMLLNDRFEANWNAFVDGRPQTLLRCNYIMRGVYLLTGKHTVEFLFQPPVGPLYISLASSGFGLLLLGVVAAGHLRSKVATPRPVAPSESPSAGSELEPTPVRAPTGPKPKGAPGKGSRKDKRLKASVR